MKSIFFLISIDTHNKGNGHKHMDLFYNIEKKLIKPGYQP